jgi:hypothetical protein
MPVVHVGELHIGPTPHAGPRWDRREPRAVRVPARRGSSSPGAAARHHRTRPGPRPRRRKGGTAKRSRRERAGCAQDIVGVGGFAHVIAGTTECLIAVFKGERRSAPMAGYLLPALLGNSIGGVALVASLAHGQHAPALTCSTAPRGDCRAFVRPRFAARCERIRRRRGSPTTTAAVPGSHANRRTAASGTVVAVWSRQRRHSRPLTHWRPHVRS